MSVHVASSNYSLTTTVHKYILIIPFNQLPTITHTAPPIYDVNAGEMFTYSFVVMSSLDRDILDLGEPMTTPPELLSDISITHEQNLNLITVSGSISIDRVLPLIVQQGRSGTISLPVEDDTNGGVIYIETQLRLRPSPPLFNQSAYEYSVSEGSSNGILGPFAMIDPNGDAIDAPSTNTTLFTVVSHVFSDNQQGPYSYFDILVLVQLNYEQIPLFSFTITAVDSVSPALSSTVSVTVNVIPINEYSPEFTVNM